MLSQCWAYVGPAYVGPLVILPVPKHAYKLCQDKNDIKHKKDD